MDYEFSKALMTAMNGRKIVGLKFREDGGIRYPLIVLEDGFEVAVLSDEEGNDGGVLSLDACPGDFARKQGLLAGEAKEPPPSRKVPKPPKPKKKPKPLTPQGSKHPESEKKSTMTFTSHEVYEDGLPSSIIRPQRVGEEDSEEETEEEE